MTKDKDNLPFGKRFGFEPVEIPFQLDGIDNNLRIDLWNAHYIYIHGLIENAEDHMRSYYRNINKVLWLHFFVNPLDDFPQLDFQFAAIVRKYIENTTWYKVYELFEFTFKNIENNQYNLYKYDEFENYINVKLRQNNSAYTLSNNKFIPITNEIEIDEIKKTQALSNRFSLTGIQEHLSSSIEFLSQKPKPEYRNSIKESISMVEVISRIIEPTENTLGKALNKLEKNQKINKTLKEGFEKLYAYTNGKNGIRHALMDEQIVDIEDAKFFLVSCSAFTNYLIGKAIKENLLR